MKNYPFNFETLDEFSNSLPYESFTNEEQALYEQLVRLKDKYNFPAVENNVGSFISFLITLIRPKIVFEMGSGYGHSAFWYLVGKEKSVEKIYLTERRKDLLIEFNQLSWPADFKQKLNYFLGDAYTKVKEVSDIDFLLIDGQKSDYKKFLDSNYEQLSEGCIIVIDNSYWRGSFLDTEQRLKHNSAKSIYELHEYVNKSDKYESAFIPFKDGVSVLRKK